MMEQLNTHDIEQLNKTSETITDKLENLEERFSAVEDHKVSDDIRSVFFKIQGLDRSEEGVSPKLVTMYDNILNDFNSLSEDSITSLSEYNKLGSKLLIDLSKLETRDGEKISDYEIDGGFFEATIAVKDGVVQAGETIYDELKGYFDLIGAAGDLPDMMDKIFSSLSLDMFENIYDAIVDAGGDIGRDISLLKENSTGSGFAVELAKYIPLVGIPILFSMIGPGKFLKLLNVDKYLPENIQNKLLDIPKSQDSEISTNGLNPDRTQVDFGDGNIVDAQPAGWNTTQAFQDRLTQIKMNDMFPDFDGKIGDLGKGILEKLPNFSIKETIKIDDINFHIGPSYTNKIGGREYAVVMVEKGDSLVPRMFYKSNSDGGWRSSPENLNKMDLSNNKNTLSKGRGISYTQETKPSYDLMIGLNKQSKNPIIADHKINESFKTFVDVKGDDGSIGRQMNKGLGDINTYKMEVSKFDDGGSLSNVQKYKPGAFTTEKHFGRKVDKNDINMINNSIPDGFIPDFKQGPVSSITSEHTLLGKIKIETYKSKLNGEDVDFSMAFDTNGRVWVDSIKSSNGKINSYGVNSEVIDSGFLTSKPIEYKSQTTGLDFGKIDFSKTYDDITPLLSELKPMKDFMSNRSVELNNFAGRFFEGDIFDIKNIGDSIKVHGIDVNVLELRKTLDDGKGLILNNGYTISNSGNGRIKILKTIDYDYDSLAA